MKGKVSYDFVELLYGQLEGKVIAFCSTTSKRERSKLFFILLVICLAKCQKCVAPTEVVLA